MDAGEANWKVCTTAENLAADCVVGAAYGVADDTLLGELPARGEARETPRIELHTVGDCLAPRQAIDAVRDAFRVARAV